MGEQGRQRDGQVATGDFWARLVTSPSVRSEGWAQRLRSSRIRSSSREPIESMSSNSTAFSSRLASMPCMARTPSLLSPFFIEQSGAE
jgi:hypothetical protein